MSQSGVKRWLRSFLRKKATIQDLPEEVLLDILSRVPKKDLILHCRLVCSLWRDLVDQPALWSRKCQHLGFNPAASGGPIQDWRTFYLHHSTPNLVKNPCGKENLDFWDLRRTSWMTISYNLPLFHKQIPCPPLDVEKCFVVAGPLIGQGVKSQRITLRDEGYSDRLMDETRPRIVVNDWFYVHWLGHVELCVKLLSADYEVLQECQLTGEHGSWCQVSHIFDDYPPGVRHIEVEHEASYYKCDVEITGTSITIDLEAPAPREGRPNPSTLPLQDSFYKTLRSLRQLFRQLFPERTVA
ncbi:F-box only protein 44 isoform X1 [Pogona vitticeps]